VPESLEGVLAGAASAAVAAAAAAAAAVADAASFGLQLSEHELLQLPDVVFGRACGSSTRESMSTDMRGIFSSSALVKSSLRPPPVGCHSRTAAALSHFRFRFLHGERSLEDEHEDEDEDEDEHGCRRSSSGRLDSAELLGDGDGDDDESATK